MVYEGMEVKEIGADVKLVRGLVEYDGDYYHRWVSAYLDAGIWRCFDMDKTVTNVDAVVDSRALDELYQRIKGG